MKTLEVLLPRDLQQAGMLDAEVCAWAYWEGLRNQVGQVRITCPGGWQRTYSMQEIHTMLRNTPVLQGEVHAGRNRSNHIHSLEGK